LEELGIEDVGIFYSLLVYFVAIWSNLWPFGIFYGYLVCFSRFGMLYPVKSGNPGFHSNVFAVTLLRKRQLPFVGTEPDGVQAV
jgi:hypothetical protein